MSKVDAIVYVSNAGHSKEYAEIIAKEAGVEAYELSDAKKTLRKSSAVLFIGWVMGSGIKGYKSAVKSFIVLGVVAVGMTPMGASDAEIKEKNNVPSGQEFFYLQGGFEWDKVGGADKAIMKVVKKKLMKDLGDKADPTDGEKDVIELINEGGSRVSAENASKVIEWINS